MCTLQNHVEKVCTLVSLNHVYFKFVYSIMAPPWDDRRLEQWPIVYTCPTSIILHPDQYLTYSVKARFQGNLEEPAAFKAF